MAKNRAKRVVLMGDLHCGHVVGLTPPDWQLAIKKDAQTSTLKRRNKCAKLQRELYKEYSKILASLDPIDVLLVNGDAIDGRGERSGGTELITTDRNEQVEMAVTCIKQAQAGAIVMTYGTPYHTGTLEDYEDNIAYAVNAKKIGSHEWLDINGLVLDCKHKTGGSSIPHGRMTSLLRQDVWNALWAERGMQPRSNILVRSHVHWEMSGGSHFHQVMTLPALQAMGTKYGGRQCEGTVDWGLVCLDVEKNGNYIKRMFVREFELQKAEALVL